MKKEQKRKRVKLFLINSMIYYFAYGSNLHHAQMKRRCPKCRYLKKYILHGYQLAFRSKYGACDIEKKVGKKVWQKNIIQ